MLMLIRNVRSYGLHHNIYIARLIIEHPREWLASLADYIYQKMIPNKGRAKVKLFDVHALFRFDVRKASFSLASEARLLQIS